MGFCVCSMFTCALLCVLSSFAIILIGIRVLVFFYFVFLVFCDCYCSVALPLGAMGCLLFDCVSYGHTHLL